MLGVSVVIGHRDLLFNLGVEGGITKSVDCVFFVNICGKTCISF